MARKVPNNSFTGRVLEPSKGNATTGALLRNKMLVHDFRSQTARLVPRALACESSLPALSFVLAYPVTARNS